jgi:hypothetical protein
LGDKRLFGRNGAETSLRRALLDQASRNRRGILWKQLPIALVMPTCETCSDRTANPTWPNSFMAVK